MRKFLSKVSVLNPFNCQSLF